MHHTGLTAPCTYSAVLPVAATQLLHHTGGLCKAHLPACMFCIVPPSISGVAHAQVRPRPAPSNIWEGDTLDGLLGGTQHLLQSTNTPSYRLSKAHQHQTKCRVVVYVVLVGQNTGNACNKTRSLFHRACLLFTLLSTATNHQKQNNYIHCC